MIGAWDLHLLCRHGFASIVDLTLPVAQRRAKRKKRERQLESPDEMRGEPMPPQSTGLQLRSTVKKEGVLELSLARVPVPEPEPDEVLIRVDASPVNPSDLGLMFGGADLSTAKVSGSPGDPVVTASVPPAMMK